MFALVLSPLCHVSATAEVVLSRYADPAPSLKLPRIQQQVGAELRPAPVLAVPTVSLSPKQATGWRGSRDTRALAMLPRPPQAPGLADVVPGEGVWPAGRMLGDMWMPEHGVQDLSLVLRASP